MQHASDEASQPQVYYRTRLTHRHHCNPYTHVRQPPQKWVGEALRRERLAAGLGVNQLAKLAGVSHSKVSECEHNKVYVGNWWLGKIVYALDAVTDNPELRDSSWQDIKPRWKTRPPPEPEPTPGPPTCTHCRSQLPLWELPAGLWCNACFSFARR